MAISLFNLSSSFYGYIYITMIIKLEIKMISMHEKC